MKEREDFMSTFFGVIGLLSLILSVGCIDGPTGYESDNWLGFFMFASVGIASMLACVATQKGEQ